MGESQVGNCMLYSSSAKRPTTFAIFAAKTDEHLCIGAVKSPSSMLGFRVSSSALSRPVNPTSITDNGWTVDSFRIQVWSRPVPSSYMLRCKTSSIAPWKESILLHESRGWVDPRCPILPCREVHAIEHVMTSRPMWDSSMALRVSRHQAAPTTLDCRATIAQLNPPFLVCSYVSSNEPWISLL